MAEVSLRIEGMHCGSCIRRVTQAIAGSGPFSVEEVRLGAARFVVPGGTEAASSDVAIAALGKAGFAAQVEFGAA